MHFSKAVRAHLPPNQLFTNEGVAFSAFSDLALAIYPLFTIAGLQMAFKVKLGLGFVLSLGIVLVSPIPDR